MDNSECKETSKLVAWAMTRYGASIGVMNVLETTYPLTTVSLLPFVQPTAPVRALLHTFNECRLAVTCTERHCRIVRGRPELHDDLILLDSAINPLPAWLGAHVWAPGMDRRYTFES